MSIDSMIGTIALFAGNFAPRGYMLCQGQLLSISQNTALFSLLGTTYGGDGQVTFALPDLRGRSPIGQGGGPGLSPIDLGELAGVPQVTLLSTNLPMHNHLIGCDNNSQSATTPGGNIPGVSNDRTTSLAVYSSAAANAQMKPTMVTPTGGNSPFSTLDPFLGLNFIICTEGIYPSRN